MHLETKRELQREVQKRGHNISAQQLNAWVCWEPPYGEGDVAEVIQRLEALPPPEWTSQTINFLSACLAKLRYSWQYRQDKRRFRQHLLHIPKDGYSRIEVRRKVRPLAKAYLDYIHSRRGSGKHKNEAFLFGHYSILVNRFAQEHPLAENRPMPTYIAFRELFYKNPPSQFILRGYFSTRNGVKVWLEDGETKASYRVTRLVKRALEGKDTKATKQISIFQTEPHWGEWEFRQLK